MDKMAEEILGRRAIDRARRPLCDARTLPREAFLDQRFYSLECERIFRRHWLACCFATDIQESGDAFPFSLLNMPLLAIRDEHGRARTFHNISPYDGCPLQMEQAQGLKRLISPYHGWEYDFNGRVAAIPWWNGKRDCEVSEIAHLETDLVEVPCEEFLGVVFVFLGPQPPNFDQVVAPISRQFDEYDLAAACVLRSTDTKPFEFSNSCKTNWKTFFENAAINVLHENFVHEEYRRSPQTPRVNEKGEKTYFDLIDDRLLGLGFSASAFAGTYPSLGIPHLGGDGGRPDKSAFTTLYPNFYFSIMPDFIEVALAIPDGPEMTRERKQFRVHSDAATDPEFVDSAKQMVGGFEQAAEEDGRVCEAVQRARHSPIFSEHFYSPFWDTLHHHFTNMVLDDLEKGPV